MPLSAIVPASISAEGASGDGSGNVNKWDKGQGAKPNLSSSSDGKPVPAKVVLNPVLSRSSTQSSDFQQAKAGVPSRSHRRVLSLFLFRHPSIEALLNLLNSVCSVWSCISFVWQSYLSPTPAKAQANAAAIIALDNVDMAVSIFFALEFAKEFTLARSNSDFLTTISTWVDGITTFPQIVIFAMSLAGASSSGAETAANLSFLRFFRVLKILRLNRVTRGAALALLGKVNLYEGKWSNSITCFQQVEALGIYRLLPDYADIFRLKNENSTESIFEIQHLSNQNPFAGSALNQWFAPATEGGYYFNAPTQSLVDAFEKNATGAADPRLDVSIGRDGQPWLNGESFSASWSPTGFLTKKHQQPLSEVSSSLKGDGDLNYIYLRYADLLLMKAEAFNEISNADSALANLNRVRQRARASFKGTAPEGMMLDISNPDQVEVRIAIRKERRVELAQEYHRYFELMRWGKTVAESALGKDFNYDTKRYFPIPQAEIDANQGIIH
jgi:hypothetical protein